MIKPFSSTEFAHYLENFIENDKFISSHNSKPQTTYKLGHNQFSHLNEDEWRDYVQRGLTRARTPLYSQAHRAPADPSSLPDSVDWVSKGGVTPVKDQGSCGSCWSFSTTGAIEGAEFAKYGELVSLSEQMLVDCDNRRNGGSDLGCNGGLMDDAFTWISKNGGLCLEDEYPYVSGKSGRSNKCGQATCTKKAHSEVKSFTDVEPNSDLALMSALAQQPVAIAIEADQKAFQLYESGVFTGTCGANLDHGVLAVGYGSLDGVDYYKVKNSWGPKWGQDGFILLQRGVEQKEGQCGILSGPPSYPVL